MVGIIDPPRTEVRDSVTEAHRAGIRTVMITGDHPLTAARIASDLGIIAKDGKALTGDQLDQLPDEAALDKATSEVSVYARVAPEHKLKIVESLQRQGNIVAMTGDGVNDAPVLAVADIGVAMTDGTSTAASESAQVVIMNDNIAAVPRAIAIARRTKRVMLQAIIAGLVLATIGMIAAAFNLIPVVVGAFLQEAIDVVSILWALTALIDRD